MRAICTLFILAALTLRCAHASDRTHDTSGDLLGVVMAAEMALNEKEPEIALDKFILAAQISQDANLAQRATQLALEIEAIEKGILASSLWAKNDPKNLQAQLVALTLSLNEGIQKSLPYLKSAFALKQEETDIYLVGIQSRLSQGSRKTLKLALEQLAETEPNNMLILKATAQSAALENDISATEQWVDKILVRQPDSTIGIELKAKLIHAKENEPTKALKFLTQSLEKYPNNHALRMFYANALMDHNQHEQAKIELTALSKIKGYKGEAFLLLGEIYLQENDFNKAAMTFEKALDSPAYRNQANFLLGQIAEVKNDFSKAIQYYQAIREGEFHVTAMIRAAQILASQNQHLLALSVLNSSEPNSIEEEKNLVLTEITILIDAGQMIEAYNKACLLVEFLPQDKDLLYARSVVASILKKIEVVEQDVNKILALEPKHAGAMNVLGFTLFTQTKRIDEARKYLEQAHALEPENPIFMDSLAWLEFRSGNTEKSLALIKQAYELQPTPDIAAHYGEILWVLEDKEKAQHIWRQAYKTHPKEPLLIETIKRFGVKLD